MPVGISATPPERVYDMIQKKIKEKKKKNRFFYFSYGDIVRALILFFLFFRVLSSIAYRM